MHEQFNSMRERLIAWHARPHYRQGGVGANRAPRHRKSCRNTLSCMQTPPQPGNANGEPRRRSRKGRSENRRGGGVAPGAGTQTTPNPTLTQSPKGEGGEEPGGAPCSYTAKRRTNKRRPRAPGDTHTKPPPSPFGNPSLRRRLRCHSYGPCLPLPSVEGIDKQGRKVCPN